MLPDQLEAILSAVPQHWDAQAGSLDLRELYYSMCFVQRIVSPDQMLGVFRNPGFLESSSQDLAPESGVRQIIFPVMEDPADLPGVMLGVGSLLYLRRLRLGFPQGEIAYVMDLGMLGQLRFAQAGPPLEIQIDCHACAKGLVKLPLGIDTVVVSTADCEIPGVIVRRLGVDGTVVDQFTLGSRPPLPFG